MALSGMHIVCAGATAAKSNGPLPCNAAWSETLASAGHTTNRVPSNFGGLALIRCQASADSFVAAAQTQAGADTAAALAAGGPRYFVPANTTYDFYANPGDYIAWVAA